MILTTDFDNTLARKLKDKKELTPANKVIDFIKDKQNNGYEIHIVTLRNENVLSKSEITNFCDANNIKIKSINFIKDKNYEKKAAKILKLKSSLHLDDNWDVCKLCIEKNIRAIYIKWQMGFSVNFVDLKKMIDNVK